MTFSTMRRRPTDGVRALLVLAALAFLPVMPARAEVLPEAKPLLNRLEGAITPLRDFQAEFVQIRHVSLTDESIEARGRLRFLPPGAFRLDYRSPDPDVLTMVGDSLLVYFAAMNQAQRHVIDRDDATRNLFLIFASKKGDVASRFDVSLAPPGPGPAALRLQPLDHDPDQPIDEIVVRLNDKTSLPEELFFREQGGDTVVFRLSDVKTNRKLHPGDFVFVPPADAEIIEH